MLATAAPEIAPAAQIPVLAFEELDSTNSEARRRGEAGEAGPLWITAKRQTAGRGRRGRPWETGAGNLAATLLLTTTKPAVQAAQVAFVAALAAGDLALAHAPEALVRLKWPNDVMVAGRKAVGILVESGPLDHGRLWLAVGVGVNLASAPEASERPAATLKDHLGPQRQRPMLPDEALTYLSGAFQHRLSQWNRSGFAAIRDDWTARAYGLGRPCSARLADGTLEGVSLGLDEDGALRLRLADGSVRRITAGDVFFGTP